ncbi:MAG: hypothetical protein JNM66_10145 [Bryobacterales bacterium]|nr:hypothetical protein [Bryobacterales bacterium]
MSKRVYLLDANVLIATSETTHTMFNRAREWFRRRQPSFATCPLTQSALIRYYCRPAAGGSLMEAKNVLRIFVENPSHTFWPDDVSCLSLPERGLRGHKQLTDYYLVALAGKNGGKLTTMDEALAATFPDICELI